MKSKSKIRRITEIFLLLIGSALIFFDFYMLFSGATKGLVDKERFIVYDEAMSTQEMPRTLQRGIFLRELIKQFVSDKKVRLEGYSSLKELYLDISNTYPSLKEVLHDSGIGFYWTAPDLQGWGLVIWKGEQETFSLITSSVSFLELEKALRSSCVNATLEPLYKTFPCVCIIPFDSLPIVLWGREFPVIDLFPCKDNITPFKILNMQSP